MAKKTITDWYTRPVLFVTDVAQAMRFYCDKLGFETVWDYQANGKSLVAQVNKGLKCEVILAEDSTRSGMSRIFIELIPEELAVLKAEIKTKKIKAKASSWGMPILEIKDPFGNELFFPTGE